MPEDCPISFGVNGILCVVGVFSEHILAEEWPWHALLVLFGFLLVLLFMLLLVLLFMLLLLGVVVDVGVGVVVEHMLAEEWPWHALSQVTAVELWLGILSLSLSLSRQN